MSEPDLQLVRICILNKTLEDYSSMFNPGKISTCSSSSSSVSPSSSSSASATTLLCRMLLSTMSTWPCSGVTESITVSRDGGEGPSLVLLILLPAPSSPTTPALPAPTCCICAFSGGTVVL